MLVLGIESSCDETGAALVRDGREVVGEALATQIEIHARYGGVVPEVAARQQLAAIIPVLELCLERAGCDWNAIDAVAATYGPGLAGPLLVGLTAAKSIAFARTLPFIGVNHLEAHISANWLRTGNAPQDDPRFPLLSLLVSGAHSELIVSHAYGEYRLLGQTRDDAAGEAFDKVARVLGLGYPGGPAIQRAAAAWPADVPLPVKLPRAWLRGSMDFSFSGIKTAVANLMRQSPILDVNAVAAAFQLAVVDVLATKTVAAAREVGAVEVALAGGVAANLALRTRLAQDLAKIGVPLRTPPIAWCTDNAAMIASAAYFHLNRDERSSLALDVAPSLALPLAGT